VEIKYEHCFYSPRESNYVFDLYFRLGKSVPGVMRILLNCTLCGWLDDKLRVWVVWLGQFIKMSMRIYYQRKNLFIISYSVFPFDRTL
jgi:hypothetical protein